MENNSSEDNCIYCLMKNNLENNIHALSNSPQWILCPACERFYGCNKNHYYSCLTPQCPPPPSPKPTPPPKNKFCDLLPLLILFLLPWMNYHKPPCKRIKSPCKKFRAFRLKKSNF